MEIISRKEALKKGLQRYFTGKPCPYGHICERNTKDSKCNICGRISSKKRHEANPEYNKKLNQKFKERNRKKLSEKQKKYYKKNIEKVKEYKQKYYLTENGRTLIRIAGIKRRALKKATSDGTINKDSLFKLFNEQDGKCFYCGGKLDFNIKRSVHLDHYIPISKGGTHTIGNVVWSCSKCNLEKSAKMPNTLLLV